VDMLEKLKTNPRPVIVDVWAPWCRPCKVLSPRLERVAREFKGKVDVWKVNADEHPDLVRAFKVFGIPTLLVFRNGKEVTRVTGAVPEERIRQLFAVALGETHPWALHMDTLLWGAALILVLLGAMFHASTLMGVGVGLAVANLLLRWWKSRGQ